MGTAAGALEIAACSLLVQVAIGCGGRSTDGAPSAAPSCVPGEQIACACTDGSSGAQRCAVDGTYGACDCEQRSSGSGGATSTGTRFGDGGSSFGSGGTSSGGRGGSGGSLGGTPPGTGSGVLPMVSGTQTLIDVFVADTGLLLVLGNEVRLVSREGKTLESVMAPREITTAAFDGTLLVVADKAKFTSYDTMLTQLASADLAVTCSSSVLMDGQQFVCGQDVDWDRVYYTYDAAKGALLATSKKYIYDGVPMRRMPGTRQFIAVEVNSEPANLFLYTVGTTGEATFLGGGPFEVSDPDAVYAFVGNPADRVVVQDGTMLTVDATKCMGATVYSGCFAQQGALGTLVGAQRFVGMDQDLDGNIYALVDIASSGSAVCSSSCLVEKIDVASRTVVSQSMHVLPAMAGHIMTVRNDPAGKALVVGYSTGTTPTYPKTNTGYGVIALPY